MEHFFKVSRHDHQSFDGFLEVDKGRADHGGQTIKSDKFLSQHSVHRLIVQHRVLFHDLQFAKKYFWNKMYVTLLNCCTSNALHLSNSSSGRRNVYVQIPNCSPLAIFQGYLQPDPGWHRLWICLPYWLGEEGLTKCCQTTKIMKKKIFKNLHWWKTFKKYIYYTYMFF